MQKNIPLFRLAIISFILFLPAAPCQARRLTVESEGVGYSGLDDRAAARDMAIHDAMLRAVEQAMGVKVDSRTIIQRSLLVDDTLVSSSHGMVKSHTILTEGLDEHGLYRVRIRAVVDSDELSSQLKTAAGRQRILLITEKDAPATGQERHINMATQAFVEAGFSFVDNGAQVKSLSLLDSGRIQKLAGQHHCDLALGFSLQADTPTCLVENYCATRSRGRLALWAGKTGTVLARAEVKNGRGFGNTRESARENSLQTAGEQLAGKLVEQLFHPSVRKLKLVVKRLPNQAAYQRLMTRLAAMRWVREVKPDAVGYHPGKTVMLLKFAGSPDLLAEMLTNMVEYSFLGRTENRLVLECNNDKW